MDNITAENIGKKARAFKHCEKLLSAIDKNGQASVKLNCTGVEFIVHKDDAIYCRIQHTKYALLDEIRSYELTTRSQRTIEQSTPSRTAPAPAGAAEMTPKEKLEKKRAKQREYQRRYLAKKKAQRASQPTLPDGQ